MKSAQILAVLLLVVLGGAAWFVFGVPAKTDPDTPPVVGSEEPQDLEAGQLTNPGGTSSSGNGLQRGAMEGLETNGSVAGGPQGGVGFFGTVVDREGRVLKGVAIEAIGSSGWAGAWSREPQFVEVSWQTLSDVEGRFTFPRAPHDRLRFLFTFQHAGFAPMQLEDQPAPLGRGRDLGTLVLGPGARLEGTVFDPLGSPLAGAEVTPYLDNPLQAFTGGSALAQPAAPSMTTDAQGKFVLEGMPASGIRLKASATPFLEAWSAPLRGAHDAVLKGVELHLGSGMEVVGKLVDSMERPVPGAQVVAMADAQDAAGQRTRAFEVTTDEGGAFLLRIPTDASRLRLDVRASGFWRKNVAFAAAHLSEHLEIRLLAMEPMQGLVVGEGGQPVPQAEVRIVTAQPYPFDPSTSLSHGTATTEDDGTFRLLPDLGRIGEGPFQICAWKEGWAPTFSPAFPLQPGPDLPGPDLRLVLQESASVHGTVSDSAGRRVAKALVILRALRTVEGPANRLGAQAGVVRTGNPFTRTTSNTDGSFTITGLPPGEYRLEAVQPGYSPAMSEDFTLSQEGYSASLILSAASSIAGRVVGDLEGFQGLHVVAQSAGQEALDVPVNAQGGFQLDGILPGTWDLNLFEKETESISMASLWGSPPFLAQRLGVVVGPGETVPVELSLAMSERGTIAGSVRINGVAVSNYTVYLVPRGPAQDDGDMGMFGSGADGGRQRVATTDHQGRYRFPSVEIGQYWLVLCRPGGFPVFQSGLFEGGPTGLALKEVALEAQGDAQQGFDVLVGAIQCDGDQVPERGAVPVQLVPEPPDGRQSHRFLLRRQGHRIDELAAGNYRLEVGQDAFLGSQSVVVSGAGLVQVAVVVAGKSGAGGEKGGSASEEAEGQRLPR